MPKDQICQDCQGDCEVCSRKNHPAGKNLSELLPKAEDYDFNFGRQYLEREARKEASIRELEDDVYKVADDLIALLLSKHKDYGPKNISSAPGGALNGLRVRIHDKTARINHLIDNDADPENESLRDSFIDLANYSIIALLVLDGKWPNE